MTHDRPPLREEDLAALYREGAQQEPGRILDERILAAAHAEVDNAKKAKSRSARWTHWIKVSSAIAVAILGVSVSWRIADEQEAVREATQSRDQAAPAAPSIPPAETAAPPPEPPARRLASPPAQAKARAQAPAVGAQPFPGAAETGAAPQLESRQRRDDGHVRQAPAAAPTLRSEAQTGDKSKEVGRAQALKKSSETGSMQGRDDAATPAAWVEHIRALRAEGRTQEAAQSLARLRLRYPDFVLPDDLK
jgi:hypothetical protein